jgi:thymidylate synthase (FAD)
MKLVSQKAEILERSENKINNIANIARICYKSENKADDESNKRLIENLIKNKHFAMLEHEDYILYFKDVDYFVAYYKLISDVERWFGIKLYLIATNTQLISGNIRAWRNFYKYVSSYIKAVYKNESKNIRFVVSNVFRDCIFFNDVLGNNGLFAFDIVNDIVKFDKSDLTIKNEILAHYRVSAKIICDRGISHEIVRHRNFSFAQESTRYVNYNKKEIEFIDYSEYNKLNNPMLNLLVGMNSEATTDMYNGIINNGYEPQLARVVLPHNLKTEIVVTGNLREWCHFFNLRLFEKTGKAHPMIKDLSSQLIDEFESKTPFSKKLIESYCNEMWELENE